MMKALTLWRPWPCAIFYLNDDIWKDIENRPRKPPRTVMGQRIAIHAGKYVEPKVFERWLKIINPDPVNTFVLTCKWHELSKVQGIIGTVIVDSVCTPKEANSPWAFGPVCIRLRDRKPLIKPIPCGGKQGYWTLPPEIERLVKRREVVL